MNFLSFTIGTTGAIFLLNSMFNEYAGSLFPNVENIPVVPMKTLMFDSIILCIFGFIWYGYIFQSYWQQWVSNDRNMEKYIDTNDNNMLKCIISDILGSFACLYIIHQCFQFESEEQVVLSSIILFLGINLPSVHHSVWEGRDWKLTTLNLTYILCYRVIASFLIYILSSEMGEPQNTNILHITKESLMNIPYQPVVITCMISLLYKLFYYGNKQGKTIFLQGINRWKNQHKSDVTEEEQMEYAHYFRVGVMCEVMRGIVLCLLFEHFQVLDIKSGIFYSIILYICLYLPTISADLWENKPYELSFMRYTFEFGVFMIHGAVYGCYQIWPQIVENLVSLL